MTFEAVPPDVRCWSKLCLGTLVTVTAWTFITCYEPYPQHVFSAEEWTAWIFWQHLWLLILLTCSFWALEKLSITFYAKMWIFMCLHASNLLVLIIFKIVIENLHTSTLHNKSQKKYVLQEYSYAFLSLSPFIVILITLLIVISAKLKEHCKDSQCCTSDTNRQVRQRRQRLKIMRCMRGLGRMFVRTVPRTEAGLEAGGEVEASGPVEDPAPGLMVDLPPDYEELLLADLPHYDTLNIRQFVLGSKTFIIDKHLKITSFKAFDHV